MAESEKIIVVENQPALSKVLEAALESYDIALEATNNANDCLASTGAKLVVVDLYLDDLDGLSLIEEIRSQNPELPIIAYVAQQQSQLQNNSASDIRRMAERSGANGFFMAPINLGELVNTIERFTNISLSTSAVA